MTHAITWFEIPTGDFDRAVDFYTAVLDREVEVYSPDEGDEQYGRAGMFTTEEGEVGGMLIETDEFSTETGETLQYRPTADGGVVVYLTVDGDLDAALERVQASGGEVHVPTQSMEEMEGRWAIIADSEGNRVGLMSSE